VKSPAVTAALAAQVSKSTWKSWPAGKELNGVLSCTTSRSTWSRSFVTADVPPGSR